ncbi:CHASE2 domain-containing protein [Planktothrix sp. FACHB-1355]|uniref:CHASE2 domain-containing protein n=1 Tax=Aerosakkonema funiforme FACHB-1375 TaxID=2949571 RepID=A0A926VIX8_9CYAN|nr:MULTISPECIES: CHASE2 domain-containing protein [Oscillatoriales]MBD2184545.1 CHASE2 domain-containing protein [Aerosakkonema funiforme FACHB-1375]MBD3559566.1 CHASE2 domain-containing protein [Planktothrix sp. FACHB-1355]
MSKLVIFRIGKGNFQSEGFPVILQIGEEGDRPFLEITGELPPAPEIAEDYDDWQSIYWRLDRVRSLNAPDGQVTNFSTIEECNNAAEPIITQLNNWLNSPKFRSIRERLIEEVKPSDTVRVLLQTEEMRLQRLPWHLWDFFTRRPNAELAISLPDYQRINQVYPSKNKVNILAILGNSTNIDIGSDEESLQNTPDAAVTFLPEPQRKDINDKLWEQSWDILFFAGHSRTEGNKGRIFINETDSLTISQLRNALTKAIAAGLRIAIFNSCDGLGLARELADLHIPQLIVMREPVPDKVAQEFLQYFLQEYSKGESLYLSVRKARERLQGLENKFPCASWLPVIYQNPAQIPPTWQQLRDGIESDRAIPSINIESKPLKPHPLTRIFTHPILVASVAITALVLGVRQMGWLQTQELKAYDQMIRLQPDDGPDRRLLVITVDKTDLQYQDRMGMERRGSLADAALNQVLKKLEPLQPRVIGLDIYRDFPVRRDQPELAKRLRETNNFIAVCKVNEPPRDKEGYQPPPEVPKERLGFSDVIKDNDGILRRYLWSMNFNDSSPCRTEFSLSFQLALYYLVTEGIEPQFNYDEKYLQLGKVRLKRLEPDSEGYRGLDNRGYQILLNYRSQKIAKQVSLRDVLTGNFNPNFVKNRIVIIGVTVPDEDNHYTPYSLSLRSDRATKGVFIQAQMVSQIISAVLDGRPLLGVWPFWGDALWIWGWSLVGGAIAWRIRGILSLGLVLIVAIVTLYGVCFFLFIQGSWVPLVPSCLALILTGASIVTYSRSQLRRSHFISKLPPPSL